ncbi:MAG: PIG-L family deacetylase, partial [Candidatus Bathyarchaeia archaeon]
MILEEANIKDLDYEEAYKTILRAESTGLNRAFEVAQRVLCIQPHPDDTDLAAGGLIARLVEGGCDITYVTMTDGSIGTFD